jgi:signal transduction histidine kinase
MENTQEVVTFFWIGTIGMIALVFTIILLVLYYQKNWARNKKQEAELLLQATLQSEKNERKRIAADLHDSVSSDLSAIRNYLVFILKEETSKKRITLFEDL